jgi:penicillin-binding protein 1A
MKADGKKLAKGVLKAAGILLLIVLICAMVMAVLVFAWVKRVIAGAPDIHVLSFRPQGFATTIYDRDGNPVEKLVMEGANREEASYEEIPKDLVNAFIAIEDERFWENNGIDVRSILRAVKGVVTGDSSAGGGSTITQQLIKNSVFNGGREKTFREKLERKLQEQYLAVELTKISDKETILTDYLNTINLGSNTLGVKVAARRYFNKELGDLTLSECTVLAGITQNPSRLNPLTGAEANAERRKRILDKMEQQGMITGDQKAQALADDVYSRIQDIDVETKAQTTPYTYFTDEVISQVTDAMTRQLGYSGDLAKKMIYSGGLSIYTTQDLGLQQIVDQEINNPENYKESHVSGDYRLTVEHGDGTVSNYSQEDVELFHKTRISEEFDGLYANEESLREDVELFKASVIGESDQVLGERLLAVPQPQASFVLMDQFTGEVLAINGGRGEKTASRTFNRATDSLRQPGSVFKVLTAFAPAIDGVNATLATVYYDEPYQVGKKQFRNWYGRYYGYCNIREAIAYSMNIVAVRCMMETVSPQLGVWYAGNMGISTLSEKDYNASTALGGITDGVTNLELTAAFGAIGAGGTYTRPVFFTKVLDHDGNVLLESGRESRQALKPETAFLLTDAMRDVLVGRNKFADTPINPTGRRAALEGMAAAGKSGTTTDNKDLWFVGYTPYYTAGIWSGNDGNQPVTGGTSYHKDIWKRIMDRVHEGLSDTGFGIPEGVKKYQICRKSGKRAVVGVCDLDPRGSAVYSEYFAPGTAPVSVCDVHGKAFVCLESQGSATEFCPETEERVFMILPEGAAQTEDSLHVVPEVCPLHPDEASVDPSWDDEALWESWEDRMEDGNQREEGPGWGSRPWQGAYPWWGDGAWNKPSQGESGSQESRPPEGGNGDQGNGGAGGGSGSQGDGNGSQGGGNGNQGGGNGNQGSGSGNGSQGGGNGNQGSGSGNGSQGGGSGSQGGGSGSGNGNQGSGSGNGNQGGGSGNQGSGNGGQGGGNGQVEGAGQETRPSQENQLWWDSGTENGSSQESIPIPDISISIPWW